MHSLIEGFPVKFVELTATNVVKIQKDAGPRQLGGDQHLLINFLLSWGGRGKRDWRRQRDLLPSRPRLP